MTTKGFRDWNPPDGGGAAIPLDEAADLEGISARIGNKTASPKDYELYDAAILLRFTKRVFAGEPVERGVLESLANDIYYVLMGEAWDERFRLPGREPPPLMHPLDARGLAIFCDVQSMSAAGMGVTEAIQKVAETRAVSYPTARTAYYKWKGAVRDEVSKDPSKK